MTDPKPASNDEVPTAVMLTYEDVCAMLQISEATLRRMISDGDFPQPATLNFRLRRFRKSDVEQWIEGAQ